VPAVAALLRWTGRPLDHRWKGSFVQPIEPLSDQQRCIFLKKRKAGFLVDSDFLQ